MSRGTTNGNVRGSNAQRRARRRYLVDRDGWRLPDGTGVVCCYRCAVPLLQDEDPEAPGQSMTVDRILPGCRGGTYELSNTRACCGPCNQETGGQLGYQQRTARAHHQEDIAS
jgi:hypothetical protein